MFSWIAQNYVTLVCKNFRDCCIYVSNVTASFRFLFWQIHSFTCYGSKANLWFAFCFYRPFRFPAILVGDGKLGGISGTISAYESLILRGYDVVAVIFEDHGLVNEGPLSSYLRRRWTFSCFSIDLNLSFEVENIV